MDIDVELLFADLSEQIATVRQGKIASQQLFAMQCAYNEQLNAHINAYISLASGDEATAKVSATDITERTLAGVAIAVKDNIDIAGSVTTAGLGIFRQNMAQHDAIVCQRLRHHGARYSGKLNLHEGALGATNHNTHYGHCYNPHDLQRTPGGSSGGSGAAVASGMAALALGTDTMGSVRIPASYCGVFGFKPSHGAVPNLGSVPCAPQLDTIGPLARSAKDISLAFELMQGVAHQDASSQSIDYLTSNKPLTLLVPEDLSHWRVVDDIQRDFYRNVLAFKDIGCQIKYIDMTDFDLSQARRAGLLICEANMRHYYQDSWRERRDEFSPYLQRLLAYVDTKTPVDLIDAEQWFARARVWLGTIFSKGDMLLMPTTPQRAFMMTSDIPANQADLSCLANFTGVPALSIPMISDNPLPAGMQLIAPFAGDRQLLSLADRWQEHTGFSCSIPKDVLTLI
ncbi:amidase [Thalassotalea maritima]|uniref:amidase n=1 Tax=Thalassotalea maritima TaxID=3242416 RepID=UPI003528D9D0